MSCHVISCQDSSHFIQNALEGSCEAVDRACRGYGKASDAESVEVIEIGSIDNDETIQCCQSKILRTCYRSNHVLVSLSVCECVCISVNQIDSQSVSQCVRHLELSMSSGICMLGWSNRNSSFASATGK